MQWFLDFPISPLPHQITYQSKILIMGSCFADVIGEKMQNVKFDTLVNPFGTIFHPLILGDHLDHAIFKDELDIEGILERDGLFFHFGVHSDLKGKSKVDLGQKYLSQIQRTKEYLEKGSHLILTFGTSWIYELPEYGRVANCHKQPQKLFEKRLASMEEMQSHLAHVFENISRAFPQLKIILTVSPVRHIKDGISENQLSKSLLRVLCGNLEKQFDFVSYFPAYEIMMDELRDYRFYKSDLIHPTEEAENYIWEKWKKAIFDADTKQKVTEIAKIQLELAHRPLNPESDSHRKFQQNLLAKLKRLDGEFDFSKEIKDLQVLSKPK